MDNICSNSDGAGRRVVDNDGDAAVILPNPTSLLTSNNNKKIHTDDIKKNRKSIKNRKEGSEDVSDSFSSSVSDWESNGSSDESKSGERKRGRFDNDVNENTKKEEGNNYVDIEDVITYVPPELKCPHCGRIFKDAVSFSCCGSYTVCEGCSKEILNEEGDKCPECQNSLKESGSFPNKYMRNLVEEFKVKLRESKISEANQSQTSSSINESPKLSSGSSLQKQNVIICTKPPVQAPLLADPPPRPTLVTSRVITSSGNKMMVKDGGVNSGDGFDENTVEGIEDLLEKEGVLK